MSLCLTCGKVNCNRDVAGHALKHYEANDKHCLVFQLGSNAIWCYSCDTYVPLQQFPHVQQKLSSFLTSDKPSSASGRKDKWSKDQKNSRFDDFSFFDGGGSSSSGKEVFFSTSSLKASLSKLSPGECVFPFFYFFFQFQLIYFFVFFFIEKEGLGD